VSPGNQLPATIAHLSGAQVGPGRPRFRRADDFTLALAWGVARRSRWLILLSLVLTTGLVALYTLLWARPVYEATASLRFEEEEVNLPELVRRLSTESQVSTEVEVLQSRALAEEVIGHFGLQLVLASPRRAARSALIDDIAITDRIDSADIRLTRQPAGFYTVEEHRTGRRLAPVHPGDRIVIGGVAFRLRPEAGQQESIRLRALGIDDAVGAFEQAMKVTRPTRDANIVTLRYRASDPELVAAVPNFMADQFIAQRQEIKKTKARSTVKFLHEQLDTLTGQLAAAEEKLRTFREKQQVVSLPDEAESGVERRSKLETDRAAIETERAALAKLLAEATAAAPDADWTAPSRFRRLAAFPTLIGNQTVVTLLQSLSGLENDRAALLGRRTRNDPDVQHLTERIQEVDDQLAAITTTYLEGLTQQVAAMDGSLRGLGKQLQRVPAKEVEFGRLQRTPTVLQDMYTLLQTKLKEAEIAQGVDDPSIGIVDPAVIPALPIRPRPVLYLAASVVLGLVLGLVAAMGSDLSNKAVRSRADVYQVTGMAVIGLIPRIRRARSRKFRRAHPPLQFAPSEVTAARHRVRGRTVMNTLGTRLIGAADGASDAAVEEAYSRLEANILFSRPGQPLRTLMFTSPLPGEGKTLSATNLALVLARRGIRVLLIDADLRCGVIHRLFDGTKGVGLTDALAERVRVEDAVRSVQLGTRGRLDVLSRGGRPPFPSALLGSRAMAALLAEVTARYDVVILDTPPLNVVTDAALLASHVDGLILVARAWVTDLEALAYAVEQLRSARAPAIGVLLNDIDPRRDAIYDGAYRYLEQSESYQAEVAAFG